MGARDRSSLPPAARAGRSGRRRHRPGPGPGWLDHQPVPATADPGGPAGRRATRDRVADRPRRPGPHDRGGRRPVFLRGVEGAQRRLVPRYRSGRSRCRQGRYSCGRCRAGRPSRTPLSVPLPVRSGSPVPSRSPPRWPSASNPPAGRCSRRRSWPRSRFDLAAIPHSPRRRIDHVLRRRAGVAGPAPLVRILAGLASAGAAIGVGHLVAALTDPAASPLLAVGSVAIDAAPTPAKEFVVRTLGNYDKPVLVGAIALLLAVVAALLGLIAWRRRFTRPPRDRRARPGGCGGGGLSPGRGGRTPLAGVGSGRRGHAGLAHPLGRDRHRPRLHRHRRLHRLHR